MQKTLIIATRRSPLALWQACHVKDRLQASYPDTSIKLLEISTKGDEHLDVSLTKFGGKGVFVKELEAALNDGRADLAVHSLKDVPMELPDGLDLCCLTARETPTDALVHRIGTKAWTDFSDIPYGTHLGDLELATDCPDPGIAPRLKAIACAGQLGNTFSKVGFRRVRWIGIGISWAEAAWGY